MTKPFNINLIVKAGLLALTLLWACSKDPTQEEPEGYETGEEYSAGINGTTFDASVNAFNNSIPGLSTEENIRFVTGNSFNRSAWVIAPSSTTNRDGLGPVFNALSCSGCHKLDGRGEPPMPGSPTVSMVYRISLPGFGAHGSPLPLENFGDQLNNRSIPNVDNEGDVNISYIEMPGTYPDGTPYSLRKPVYEFQHPELSGVLFSPRVAPKMTGAGFFDGLTESAIIANADPNDADKDGISGKANYVWDENSQTTVIGRIGWKSSQPSVRQQVAHAFLNDIGITSSMYPSENLWGTQKDKYGSVVNGGNPEINDSVLNNVVYYTSALAMPARRNYKDADVLAGKKIFNQLGCIKCHVSSFKLGIHPEVAQINNQVIRPYSDLLLHDMGSGLADNREDFLANGQEWRTSPLWGIGLYKTVNGHQYLLHDGRARGIEEAILWHGGEASNARNTFMTLSKADRDRLITFINSL